MKSNTAVLLLLVALAALAIALVAESRHHASEKEDQTKMITSYSNEVAIMDGKLKEQTVVNHTLETNLTATQMKDSNDMGVLAATSNNLDKAQADLAGVMGLLTTTSNNLDKAQSDLAEKDKRIAGLENQNTELDKQSADLHGEITNLETQIQATQRKLDASEGDRAFLTKELRELQAKKDELEKELSDLAFLKETVRKLKDELAISRRLDLIRRGLDMVIGAKGAERLIHPYVPPPPPSTNGLHVELHQNGEVKITTTNSPSITNSPAVK